MSAHPSLDADLSAPADALPAMDPSDIEALRALGSDPDRAEFSGGDGVAVEELSAPGLDGAPAVRIRLLRPAGVHAPLPVLLAIHGGGFVLGRASDLDYLAVEAVRRLGISVAGVEYRLAPEHPYPQGLDDCLAALRFLHSEGETIGIDRERIAVGGSSAGGGIAAGLALRIRDEGGPSIAFQLLLSPAVDDRTDAPSWTDLVDPPVLAGPHRGMVWNHYLGTGYAGEETTGVSPHAVPARAATLAGLPPTYIAAMEVDPLRDANIEFASRLLQGGVRTELHVHPGAFHGSVELVPGAASSARILDGLLDALGRALTPVRP
jgi:acetyl esterase/lipase